MNFELTKGVDDNCLSNGFHAVWNNYGKYIETPIEVEMSKKMCANQYFVIGISGIVSMSTVRNKARWCVLRDASYN